MSVSPWSRKKKSSYHYKIKDSFVLLTVIIKRVGKFFFFLSLLFYCPPVCGKRVPGVISA